MGGKMAPLLLLLLFYAKYSQEITITFPVPFSFRSPPNPVLKPKGTPYPCLYGLCNGTCCEKQPEETFFDCANGQKINKSLVCNRVNDCQDGSDESGCAPQPSKITLLPKEKVEIYCEDFQSWNEESGTLILECESVGYPTPIIRWKKYEGHVPSKCQQFSKRGHGILKCPNFQQSDQGAYSCVAENNVKSAESQPKSLAKCSNKINCKGFKVVNEEQVEHCLECYCSGKTTECQSLKSNSTKIEIPFTESRVEIFAKDNGQIVFIPTKTGITPDLQVRLSAQEITYCSFSENDFPEMSFLKSFGRSIIIPRYKGKTDFLEKAPEVIIRGNGLSLMYTASLLPPPQGNEMDVWVKLWPGNWHHLNQKAANRKDMMKVLTKVDSLFIRCEYQGGKILSFHNNKSIIIESSRITQFSSEVSYVEKCKCPSGYDGLSCETCAAGYKQKLQDDGFICERIGPIKCEEGYKGANCSDCDTDKGYYKKGDKCLKSACHPQGSVSMSMNLWKKCTCKQRVTGDFCDRCQTDSFYLHEGGCLECWCSGVTSECTSSNLSRTVIASTPRGGYNSSDGRNFWLLPSDFSGNRLTSYGGYLNYTMTYRPGIPKENTKLTVELLSVDDVVLVYTHPTVDNSTLKTEKSWFVPLIEINWRKSNKTAVTRGEFLKVLSKVRAIYIESPYHLSSGQANLTSTRMTSATAISDGGGSILAREVEECNCPLGYTGLSCESCAQGYYKKRNGTVIVCIKCNCAYCDPNFGCSNCPELHYRDNPEWEKVPVCKPCPCNGNGLSCEKDDHGQIFCRCKPGYSGMHCENTIPKGANNLTIAISPRRITGPTVGTTVLINCSVIGSEEMKLTIKKTVLKGTTSNDYRILVKEGRKILESVRVVVEDGLQSIECLVHDSEGRLAGQVLTVVKDIIIVQERVKVTNCYSERIDMKEFENREIICEATGIPTPWVNWYKMRNGSKPEKLDTLAGVHTIENASLSDNGTIYTCIAENSMGDKDACSQVLFVRKKCEVINIKPKEVREIEGRNISIVCRAERNPVSWNLLEMKIKKPIISRRIKVTNGLLVITNASVTDSGTYICTAKGENELLEKTIQVLVEEEKIPPTAEITEYDQTLKEGYSFTVNCLVTGKPTPVVSWVKLNDSLANNVIVFGTRLSINKATLRNSGIYECKATSISGNATSYISITVEAVGIPPRSSILEEGVIASEGEVVNLTCLATGYPRPRLTWFAANATPTIISREIDISGTPPNKAIKEQISFKVPKVYDVMVTCTAENNAGKDAAFIKIKVLQPTEGVNETVEIVPIGSYMELQCDLAGDLKWEKVGGRLMGDECKIPNGLMFPSVQVQHNGTYLCKSNSQSKKISMIVTGFVPKFSKVSRSYLVLPVRMKSHDEIRIELWFNTYDESGVLIQDENGFVDIYLEKRKIHLNIYSNSEDSLDIVMVKAVDLNKWFSLVVSINKNFVDMTVYDDHSLIYERKTEKVSNFNFSRSSGSEGVFIGGPVPKARHGRRMFFRRYAHFDGCISRLSINRVEFNIVKDGSHSRNVSLCRVCSERVDNPCGEKGTCFDAPTQRGFICVCSGTEKGETCSASCEGKGCENQIDLCPLLNPCNGIIHTCIQKISSLQCRCAYGYAGNTCQEVQEYSFCAKGNGYVKLPSTIFKRQMGVEEVIRMSFTLDKLSGHLFWQGDKANHLTILVHNGLLHYVYLNQHTKLEVRTTSAFEVNKKYSIVVKRLNATAVLEVQSPLGLVPNVHRNSMATFHTNRVTGDIYLGNVPNNMHHDGNHVGLSGCIHYIAFGEEEKINLPKNQIEKLNVFLPQKPYEVFDSSGQEFEYSASYSDYNET